MIMDRSRPRLRHVLGTHDKQRSCGTGTLACLVWWNLLRI